MGVTPLHDILIIKWNLMRHLRLQNSEIMRMPLQERNFYHRQLCDEVDEHNRHVAQVQAQLQGSK